MLHDVSDPGPLDWLVVRKTADESRTSTTTVTNDLELQFLALNGVMYEVEVVMIYASPAGAGTPDMKFAFGEDATSRGVFFFGGLWGTNDAATGGNPVLANTSATTGVGTGTANRTAKAFGSYLGTGALFHVLFAQNTSDANATIMRAGSVVRYRPLS